MADLHSKVDEVDQQIQVLLKRLQVIKKIKSQKLSLPSMAGIEKSAHIDNLL